MAFDPTVGPAAIDWWFNSGDAAARPGGALSPAVGFTTSDGVIILWVEQGTSTPHPEPIPDDTTVTTTIIPAFQTEEPNIIANRTVNQDAALKTIADVLWTYNRILRGELEAEAVLPDTRSAFNTALRDLYKTNAGL